MVKGMRTKTYETMKAQGEEEKKYELRKKHGHLNINQVAEAIRQMGTYTNVPLIQKWLKDKMGIDISLRTLKTRIAELKAGEEANVKVDGWQKLTLEQLSKKLETETPTTRLAKEITEKKELWKRHGVSEATRAARESLAKRVTALLGKVPSEWTYEEIADRVVRPMLEWRDPFTGKEMKYTYSAIEHTIVDLRNIASAQIGIEQKDEKRRIDTRQQGVYISLHPEAAQHETKFYLKVSEWDAFEDAILKANGYRAPNTGSWSLGQLVRLMAIFQVVTGARERKETLMLTWGQVNMAKRQISVIATKWAEIWEQVNMNLFDSWLWREEDKFNFPRWKEHQETRGLTKSTDRVFPLSYDAYTKAIQRARALCSWEGAQHLTPHAFRRTHATWLLRAGCSLNAIAGEVLSTRRAKGWLGIGWKTIDTLRENYAAFEEEMVEPDLKAAMEFNPRKPVTEEQKRRTKIFDKVTGLQEVKGEKEE